MPQSAAGGWPAEDRGVGTTVGVVYLQAHEKAPNELRRKIAPNELRRKIKRKDKRNISIGDIECERGRWS